jgi:hypothetical protein
MAVSLWLDSECPTWDLTEVGTNFYYSDRGDSSVRILVPPIAQRREIDRRLTAYFLSHRPSVFRRAISDFCRFYAVKLPSIQWFEYIDWGRTAGRTFEDGRIHLVHPENWKRCRVYRSERMWVQTVYHELGHYVFWCDAERKADAFTLRMVRGLRRCVRRPESCSDGRSGSKTGVPQGRHAAQTRVSGRRRNGSHAGRNAVWRSGRHQMD